jgi:hypothetical protein
VALPEESAPPTALRDLVTHPTPKISRSLALEGLNAPRRLAATARRRGLWLAFGALSIGAALETLLILQALGRGRKRLAALSAAAFDALGEPTAVAEDAEGSRALLTVAALLFITLLGFGLLAGLLAMSTTG